MPYFLVALILLAGTIIGCGSLPQPVSLVGSFQGKSVREPKPPVDGAITTVYIPIYTIGVVFTETEFSGSQQRDDDPPIIIRGKYQLLNKPNTIRFIADASENGVSMLDGIFSYTLVEKTLTLTKQDGSFKLVLTRLPER